MRTFGETRGCDLPGGAGPLMCLRGLLLVQRFGEVAVCEVSISPNSLVVGVLSQSPDPRRSRCTR